MLRLSLLNIWQFRESLRALSVTHANLCSGACVSEWTGIFLLFYFFLIMFNLDFFIILSQLVYLNNLLFKKWLLKIWKDGSEDKNIIFNNALAEHRGSIPSIPVSTVAHNLLLLHFLGVWCHLLSSAHIWPHKLTQTYMRSHTYTSVNKTWK